MKAYLKTNIFINFIKQTIKINNIRFYILKNNNFY